MKSGDGELSVLSDEAIQEKIERLSSLIFSNTWSSLPDKGKKMRLTVQQLKEEQQRRRKPLFWVVNEKVSENRERVSLSKCVESSENKTKPMESSDRQSATHDRHSSLLEPLNGVGKEAVCDAFVSLLDKDIEEKIVRLTSFIASKVFSSLPDKGKRIRVQLQQLEEEQERRRKPPFRVLNEVFENSERVSLLKSADSSGEHIPRLKMEGIIKLGPWGGSGGSKWNQWGDTTVRKIIIVHGWAIDSIVFVTNCNGKDELSEQIGGAGGMARDEIHIRYPDEYMTSISGHIGKFDGIEVLRSLKISTNFQEYGPYGGEEGTRFSIPIDGGIIVGLHGRAGRYMDALGVFVKPVGNVLGSDSDNKMGVPRTALASPSLEISESDISRPLPTAWGGVGGKPWDDGIFSKIRGISIHTDGCAINAIEVLYKNSGSTEISCLHGSSCGHKSCGIKMDETEHLVSVSGYYCTTEDTEGFEVIKSLTFFTNKTKYGPIGIEVGKYFSTAYYSSVCGEVVGFFGRSSTYLDAIGVHMRYF